jgi:hypothetical protein
MFENDARPSTADPVGNALRSLATEITNEVEIPDGARFRTRARVPRGRRRLRINVPALSITAAAVITAALLVILLRPSGGSHGPSTRTPTLRSHTELASHASTVAGVTFVSYNLNQVVTQAPNMMVRSSTITYPDQDANYDAIAFGAGNAWVLESARPLGGPAKPLGDPNRSDCGALIRLSASTMATTGTLSMSRCPEAVAFGDGSVWVVSFQTGVKGYRLTRVNPANMTVQASTIVDGGSGGITPQGDSGAKYLFVTSTGSSVEVALQTASGPSQIITLNAKTLIEVGAITIPEAHGLVTALAGNNAAGWAGTDSGWLYRIDPRTGAATSARQLGAWIRSVSVSRRAIWMTTELPQGRPASAYPGFDTLQLNPVSGKVLHDTHLPLLLVATRRTSVWGIFAAPQHGDYIANIDPATGTVSGATSSPFKSSDYTPDTIGVSNGAAWIINTNLQTLTKVVPIQ